ncbi:hypothetical protein [Catenuloplanes atrovinosus]|uniref:Uncharacterized protein n=1 Tax=Catenuloplanes atrovinosus TaxID=137266 RepID=A0AAE3YYT7_9ACTN|nr:hypothetical protein [Catenuloplanes atrovinosus]MDR7280863.1 hypothetical protein [Catenuloplanes atrovinosus]
MLNRNEMLRHRRQMQRRIRDVVAERRMALLDGEATAEPEDESSEEKSKQDCAA